ncbi:CHAT domain-containing protein [Lacinutrix chionoecetis]
MKNAIIILCLLYFGSVFSQRIEDDIYNATETFNNKKSAEALAQLNKDMVEFEDKLTSIDDYMAFIYLLVNKAHYLEKQNKNSAAITAYEKAWTLYKDKNIAKAYDFDVIENCMKPLGILYNRVGDYTSSENITKNYITLAKESNNNKQLIAGSINLSRLYQTLGRYKQSIAIANYGLSIKGIHPQQKKMLQTSISRSEIRLNQKVTVIDKIIVKNPTLGSIEDTELAYELAMQKKDYSQALKSFKRLKNLKKDNLSSASVLSKLYFQEAQLYYFLNDRDLSNKTLKKALKILLPDVDVNTLPTEENLYPENAFIEIFDLFAALQTKPNNALTYYNLSFYVSDMLAENTTSQESKLILLNEQRKRSEKCLNLLYTLQNTNNTSEFTLEALKLSERYKSTLLKETVSNKDLIKLHPKDSLLIEQQAYLNKQETLTNRLIRTPFGTNTNQKDTIRAELSAINIKLKDLKFKIENKYAISTNTSFNIAKLNAKLIEDDATLVHFFYGKKAIYQIIVSGTATAFNKIVLNDLHIETIANFINYFDSPSAINNNILKFTEDAFKLYKILQLNEIKDKTNLLIIPDGLLHFVPFDALLTEETQQLTYEKMPFFLKKHTSVFNASVSLYLKENQLTKEPEVLGVFPVFKNTTAVLKYSVNEAKSINDEIKTTLLMEEDATKTSFLKNASRYSILHLSTHGKSGDFFEPAQIAFHDEALAVNELYSMNLNPDLVVLSACETGIGRLQKGEGAMSIARGFQYAGAKRVLFSLWQISDLSTSQIMASFYKILNNNNSISHANHQSKLDYLNNKNIKNLKKSPYYWSAFTLYGGFDKVTTNRFYIWIILGVSVLIILLLLWLFKQKNGKHTLGISF